MSRNCSPPPRPEGLRAQSLGTDGASVPSTLWPGKLPLLPGRPWLSLASLPVVGCVMVPPLAPPFASSQLFLTNIPLVSVSPDCTTYSKVSTAVTRTRHVVQVLVRCSTRVRQANPDRRPAGGVHPHRARRIVSLAPYKCEAGDCHPASRSGWKRVSQVRHARIRQAGPPYEYLDGGLVPGRPRPRSKYSIASELADTESVGRHASVVPVLVDLLNRRSCHGCSLNHPPAWQHLKLMADADLQDPARHGHHPAPTGGCSQRQPR